MKINLQSFQASHLFILFLVFLPFDSVPFWPLDNQYRPISVFFIFLVFVLTFKGLSLTRPGLFFLFVLLFLNLYSLFLFYFFHQYVVFSSALKFLVVSFVSFLAFEGIYKVGSRMIRDLGYDKFFLLLSKVFLFSLLLTIPIFLLQVLAAFNIIPDAISSSITNYFSYRTVDNRVQLFSGEASMMFRNLLLVVIVSSVFMQGKMRLLVLLYFSLVLILSGSTYSIVILCVFGLLYYFLFLKLSIKFIFQLICVTSLLIFVLWMYKQNANDYASGKLDIVLELASNPLDFFALVASSGDGSAFQRLINPVIGLMVMDQTHYLGGGAESFFLFYPNMISENFPYAIEFESVKSVISGETYITPKSLFAKLGAEFGILGLGGYIFFILYLKFRISKLDLLSDKKTFTLLKLLFCYVVICSLNQDSYMYLNLLLSVALILLIIKNHRAIRRDVFVD